MKKSGCFIMCAVALLLVVALALAACTVTVDNTDSSGGGDSTVAESSEEKSAEVDKETVLNAAALRIENGGDYVLENEINGTVVINTKEKLTLTLKNARVTGNNGPAIYVINCKSLNVVLEGDSVLADSATYSAEFSGAKGAFFSEDDLVIGGSGSLTVTSSYAHGLACDDGITLESGALTVTAAVKDAVHVNDYFTVKGGSFTVLSAEGDGVHCEAAIDISGGALDITATGDGIKSAAKAADEDDISAEEASGACNVAISGGTIKINTAEDGIQADGALTVSGGDIAVTTTGEVSSSGKNDFGWGTPPGGFGGGGMHGGRGDRMGGTSSSPTGDTQSASSKGLKAGAALTVSGGTISVSSTDDALHSNGTVEINGGSLVLSSGDDGIHGDGAVTINGGDINITGSYEGIEGMTVEINDGVISVVATDDGLNAADGSASNNRPGQANSNNSIVVNGGKVYVNAEGDGLDSNGALTINGGTVLVDGPLRGGNSPIDADGTRLVNGGVLVAVGSADMLENPQQGSKQSCAVIYTGTVSAGETLALTDTDGNVILCYTLTKSSQAITLSALELEVGNSYTLYRGVEVSGTAAFAKLYYGDGVSISGGTVVTSFNMTSTITQVR